jgi:hypothetical protein
VKNKAVWNITSQSKMRFVNKQSNYNSNNSLKSQNRGQRLRHTETLNDPSLLIALSSLSMSTTRFNQSVCVPFLLVLSNFVNLLYGNFRVYKTTRSSNDGNNKLHNLIQSKLNQSRIFLLSSFMLNDYVVY